MNSLLTIARPYYELTRPCLKVLTDLPPSIKMPDSPDSLGKSQIAGSLSASLSSHKSSAQGMNGSLSPHVLSSGRTPSPPSTNPLPTSHPLSSATPSPMDIPMSCKVRQLSKLKRFLTTLQQFGNDISLEVGERVHSLILNLVTSQITTEEFHQKIQDITSFPLRPFAVPFLKAHLPMLQSEILHFARVAKQSPQQYLHQHEQIVLDPTSHPSGEPFEIFQSDIKETSKRRSPPAMRLRENGCSDTEGPPPIKRHQPMISPNTLSSRISPAVPPSHIASSLAFRLEDGTNGGGSSTSSSSAYRDRYERFERFEREFCRTQYGTLHREHMDDREMEEEWKNIHTMLNCILGMVEKTKRALAILHHRSYVERPDFLLWSRRHMENVEYDHKKRPSELISQYKSEDRVAEVRRRPGNSYLSEEAVNEVKRQAVAELQKAVSVAEAKASELVAAERAKMELLLGDARRQATEEALASVSQQDESNESCWNCGRKANETCSGCNVARYCGAFCQHKDWENHHRVCSQGTAHSSGSSSSIQTPATSNSSSSAVPTSGGKTLSPSSAMETKPIVADSKSH